MQWHTGAQQRCEFEKVPGVYSLGTLLHQAISAEAASALQAQGVSADDSPIEVIEKIAEKFGEIEALI